MQKKVISTREQCADHPFTGQNTQRFALKGEKISCHFLTNLPLANQIPD